MTSFAQSKAKPISTLFPAIGWGHHLPNSTRAADSQAYETIDRPWILCIDDDQEFSHGLKLQFQSRGYDVVRAFAGMDGYRLAFEIEPVAILLDLHLPNGNGEEILSQLCCHPMTSHIPVAIVTGMKEHGLKERLIGMGARDLFEKPISMNKLADAVDRYRNEG